MKTTSDRLGEITHNKRSPKVKIIYVPHSEAGNTKSSYCELRSEIFDVLTGIIFPVVYYTQLVT